MNPRSQKLHAPRSALCKDTDISSVSKSNKSIKEPSSRTRLRPIFRQQTPVKPRKTNISAVSPRKNSAPNKLYLFTRGAPSDLPSTVSVRRKVSVPPPKTATAGALSIASSSSQKRISKDQGKGPPALDKRKHLLGGKKMSSSKEEIDVDPPPITMVSPSHEEEVEDDQDDEILVAHYDKTISDLVRTNESKKQEIAALRIEINRLKESIREFEKDRALRENAAPSDSLLSPDKEDDAIDGCNSDELQKADALASLSAENRLLRNRLLQLGVSFDCSPLSDQEKEMLLSKVSVFSQTAAGMEGSCSGFEKGDWDNKSSSSMSEMSVACLQDRIQQMEETHYCTNEELQATLQELDDLRAHFSESQHEIQQLQEEKQVLLESLTQQTEKLNELRIQNDTLKYMLIQHAENSEDLSQCEKTRRLMDLLKSVQEDKEFIQMKQEELEQRIAATKETEDRFRRESQLIRDRMKLLESMAESANVEKKLVEEQLLDAMQKIKASDIEYSSLKTALDAARNKITELEAAVVSGEKSELADVLSKVREEKERLDRETSALQKKSKILVCENEKLKDQISSLQDDLRLTRNNAKTQVQDMEWQHSKLKEDKNHLEQEIEQLHKTVTELQLTCQRHLEDKRELKASLSESQKKFMESGNQKLQIEKTLCDERHQFDKQVEEWKKFQNDLLTVVRVANEFKIEAQNNLEKIQQENLSLKDKVKQLDLEKLKFNNLNNRSEKRVNRSTSVPFSNGDISILSTTRPLSRGDSRVKSLIETIESATKQVRIGSCSSSTSSICSNSSDSGTRSATIFSKTEAENFIRTHSSVTSPLKESGSNFISTTNTVTVNSGFRNYQRSSLSDDFSRTNTTNLSDTAKMSQLGQDKSVKPILSNKLEGSSASSTTRGYGQIISLMEKDPLALLAQSGGSKRNALLKWCQTKTLGYNNVDITNFSSSWNDGLALCALLHSYLPEKIPYNTLTPTDKRRNFELALSAAESVGVSTTLDISDMITTERPKWQIVYNYVTSIYCHFET